MAGIHCRAGSGTQASDVTDLQLPRVLLDGGMLCSSLQKAEARALGCCGWVCTSCSKGSAPTNSEEIEHEPEEQMMGIA